MKNTTKENYKIVVDLKPALDEEKLDKRVQKDFQKYTNKRFENSLNDLLPKKLIPIILEQSEIPLDTVVHQISREQRKKLVHLLKNFTFTVKRYRPIEEAIITSGGIKVSEINSSTMESKLIEGLFFAGEVIDVDAYTGGFNLQIAFSTGYLAGINC
jgi:predicted Rossmann fold flavoprotein